MKSHTSMTMYNIISSCCCIEVLSDSDENLGTDSEEESLKEAESPSSQVIVNPIPYTDINVPTFHRILIYVDFLRLKTNSSNIPESYLKSLFEFYFSITH